MKDMLHVYIWNLTSLSKIIVTIFWFNIPSLRLQTDIIKSLRDCDVMTHDVMDWTFFKISLWKSWQKNMTIILYLDWVSDIFIYLKGASRDVWLS